MSLRGISCVGRRHTRSGNAVFKLLTDPEYQLDLRRNYYQTWTMASTK
jgi:hypothetical protein